MSGFHRTPSRTLRRTTSRTASRTPNRPANRPARPVLPMLALAAATAATVACGGAGGALGDILTGGAGGGQPQGQPQGGTVTVEIQEVQQQQQRIIVNTEDGQQGPVLYDQNTTVVYQNQQYPVNALERGDVVDMDIRQIQQGYYAEQIRVRTPVQERQGGYRNSPQPDVYRVEGTVGEVNTQQWMFTLNMTQGGTAPVYLPSNAPASARDRLRQMVPGDYVRVQIRPIDEQRAELVAFGWDR